MNLLDALPQGAEPDDVFEAFAAEVSKSGLELYPAQTEALIEIVSGNHVILATPTGSGKSLVAAGAHFTALARDERSFYTAPIKALVSEKFFALCDMFGAENVGMMTGDASVNPGAPIICATAEILANLALREGKHADVGLVVMDEFHFYAEPDRGWAWQVPLLELTNAQFLLMSATLGDVSFFTKDIERRTGKPVAVVASQDRPVPLHFSYVKTPVHETIDDLLHGGGAPIYVVHFTQTAALERAQALTSVPVATRAERDLIAEMIGGFRFTSGFGPTLSRLVRSGIGVHHAGMLPKYRRLVETLAQAGLLKVICGTDTLGVGINVPIRTVLLSALSKYDGVSSRHLKVREFHQIAGRAGRAGYDTAGTVVVQAPEHIVENERATAKAGDDPKKKRKLVMRKPPEGFVSWSDKTFDKLVSSDPETLTSSFAVSSSMVLNVIARPGDPFTALRTLLTDNHEPRARQLVHIKRTIGIVRELLAAEVLERHEPDADRRTIRLTIDLQRDFALNQPLSPFAVAAIDLLDKESPSYALDVLSVVEATLEDPRQVISAQRFKARGEAVAGMKSEGIEYEERMELLEDVTHPQPLAELLEAAFHSYRRGQPWVADSVLRPKAVARDLFERAMTFVEYVGFYGLARSEGLVLRYLADAYKALRQTVPESARTEEVTDLIEWLGELVRQVDSSLIDEWERLTSPEPLVPGAPAVPTKPRPVTGNVRAFRVLVRNSLFRRVELAARKRWWDLGELDGAAGWDSAAWQEALEPYFEEHSEIGTGPNARGPGLLILDETSPERWTARQIFDDPAGDHDWGFSAEIDLAASDEEGTAVITITAVDQL